jgi:uncharacterized protein
MLGKLTPTQIDALLNSQHLGRVGCHANGRTYIVPISYAYDGHAIYAHSAEGLKLQMMRENPEVCFEVERIVDHANWETAIVSGRFEELHGHDALAALALLVARLSAGIVSETARPPTTDAMGVDEHHLAGVRGRKAVPFRIVVSERTGRFERR